MRDNEYDETKSRLERYLKKWHPLMQMGWYNLSYEYVRGYSDEDITICALTKSYWTYRRATIIWYMQKLSELSDEELEDIVVHEFTHIVLAPVTQDQPVEWHEQVEYTTQTVAVILQHIFNQTGGMSHEITSNTEGVEDQVQG